MFDPAKHRLLIFFSIIVAVLAGTYFAVKFTSGYRVDLSTKKFKATGVLVTNSSPTGAQVFINGKFTAATNGFISLDPSIYSVEIKKDGFVPWKKDLAVKAELVTLADAFLFPQVPDLQPLTFSSVNNPKISPDNTRIVYSIASPDLNAGLWVMDLNENLLNINHGPKQIAKSKLGADLANASYSWSPDSRQILVEFPASSNKYLLDPSQLNPISSVNEVSLKLKTIQGEWQKEEDLKSQARFKKLPLEMQGILASHAAELQFNSDGTKVLYLATASAQIPDNLIPPVVAASTQKQSRTLEANKLYVYDIKEDRNFSIPFAAIPSPTATPKPKTVKSKLTPTPTPISLPSVYSLLTTPRWFPTGRHLVWINEDKLVTCEHDGTNVTTIYSGAFTKPFVFITPSSDKLVILTQINIEPNKPNLYSVSLR